MYNDNILDYFDYDFTKNFDVEIFYNMKRHPGNTFVKIIRILHHIDPLKNTEEDLIRFYNDICNALGIPSEEEMVAKGITAISNRVNRITDTIISERYKYYMEVMKLRQKDPVFFINGLIHSDKTSDMAKRLSHINHVIFDDHEKKICAPFFIDALQQLLHQLVHKVETICPLPKIIGNCPFEALASKCNNIFPSTKMLSNIDCPYLNVIRPLASNYIKGGEYANF
jgi:hypothetical protein